MVISGYAVTETLYTGAHTVTYRGRREADGLPVLIRVARRPEARVDQVRLRQEQEILAGLGWEHFLPAPGPALISEDPGGVPLRSLIRSDRLDLGARLLLGKALAQRIAQLHGLRFVHKDINTDLVLADPETGRLTLLSVASASRLAREVSPILPAASIEGRLLYISPEQTGRMNRALDYRTDLYSLGVVLYEVLTGELPFHSADPMEIVHAHLARQPVPLHQLRPEIPGVVGTLVLRLLAKDAEDRYQSSRSVADDLETCAKALPDPGAVERVILGTTDASDVFRIPQKLYGRDQEVAALLAAFERAAGGRRELILVGGYSGVGKSAVVHEIHKPVARQRALFISGKYEQYRRDIPYYGISQALRDLLRQALMESAERVAALREELLGALGADAQVIVDVIPELSRILGPQPPAAALGASDAESRFRALFSNFIASFARPERPLVIFLDDMQWADAASLTLLRQVMTDPEPRSLLVVAAYRDNEVEAGHPLLSAVAAVEKAEGSVSRVSVGPLSLPHVVELVADAMRASPERVEPVTRLCMDKTLGNPFFLIQLLGSLHEEGLLRFDPESRAFTCDVAEARRQKGSADNVVDLMIRRLERLPPGARRALSLAACLGSRFSLGTLSSVWGRPRADVAAELWASVREGQLLPVLEELSGDDRSLAEVGVRAASEAGAGPGAAAPPWALGEVDITYRFAHDRVQQAAYSLLSEEDRRATHLLAGRLMLASATPADLEAQVFDIVDHLNLCVDMITSPEERRRLAEANLLAAQRARRSTAYDTARKVLRVGASLLSDRAWEDDYPLAFALHQLLAECEFLAGNLDEAERVFDTTRERARTLLESAAIVTMRTTLYRHSNKLKESVETALSGLRLFDPAVPRLDDTAALEAIVAADRAELGSLLEGRSIEGLADLPTMSDPHTLAMMDLLEELFIVAVFFGPVMVQLGLYKTLILSLKHGNTRASCSAYAAYGALTGAMLGDYRAGCSFGRLGLTVARKLGEPRAQCRTGFWHGACVSHFREPIAEGLATLREACDIGLRVGDPAYAAYSAFFTGVHAVARGESLDDAIAEINKLRRHMDTETRRSILCHRQMALSLKGQTRALGDFSDGEIEEGAFYAELGGYSPLGQCHFHAAKLQALCLAGRWEEALPALEAGVAHGPIEAMLMGQLTPATWRSYAALTLARALGRSEGEAREAHAQALAANLDRLRAWAESCPANFAAPYLLAQAELGRAEGRDAEALDLYERALGAAREGGFLQHEALAAELCGLHHEARGRRPAARAYLTVACDAYARWGASAKAADLRSKHALSPAVDGPAPLASDTLDLATVMKAVQAISSEIVLDRLHQGLLRIILENAGAERGFLLVERDGGEQVLASSPGAPHVWQALVEYVRRTDEHVVLDDASVDQRYAADAYVEGRGVKSVLCAPVHRQNRRVAVLYLENNLVAGAFTPERLRMVEILCAQAAISLENAWLYETLEHKVVERTRELSRKNAELETAMRRLLETRQQLVMQEKLASLGALTAGIAHEIKNPLNFITNFSESQVELCREVREEAARLPEEVRERLDPILDDLGTGAAKINEHGRRADAILRAMLDHSRGGEGASESADVNALVSEYVSLACTGLRARDGVSRVVVEESYERPLPTARVVPKDIGRVVVNLVNNAWYAVHAKARAVTPDFVPTIQVHTRRAGDRLEIRVRDNGTGVPAGVQGSLFQPFFTTKPPGQGTGLGLSISHEIVHSCGGTLAFETEEGSFTEFVVTLPAEALN